MANDRMHFPDRRAAWRFLADRHPTFEQANQAHASTVLDAVVEAAGATITGYDEGNPGSSHLVRVHTTAGTIWINPGRVFVPSSMPVLHQFESVPAASGNGVDYLLPHTGGHGRSPVSPGTTEVCPNCFVTLPISGTCGLCS